MGQKQGRDTLYLISSIGPDEADARVEIVDAGGAISDVLSLGLIEGMSIPCIVLHGELYPLVSLLDGGKARAAMWDSVVL